MRTYIPHFIEINALHRETGFSEWTHHPGFQIFSTEPEYQGLRSFMPPYTQDFYQIGFSTDLAGTSFRLQDQKVHERKNILYVVSAGQVISWTLGKPTRGYVLYLKKEFLDFYPGEIEEVFPFLRLTEINLIEVQPTAAAQLYQSLKEMRETFALAQPFQHQILQGLLLAFLYRCKALQESQAEQELQQSKAMLISRKFQQLVNQHYLAHWSIETYAAQLALSPNHLSAVVKQVTNKSAKSFIYNRLLIEAQKFLTYTDLSISEIAYRLGFEEQAHFGRFFRKESGYSPSEYRANRKS